MFVYALFYYRLLGLVMIASLVLSAVVVYACLVLLGREIGFTLSLAGIAGFIVSIGITADSFVVYFERLKDEIREGRTLRSAVPRAWVRARRTILSADAVSFLAAAILYLLAIGDVKGFAFTLGMSTVLDLVVVFLFTHPLMAVLARFKSFGSSRFSGLGQVEHTRRPAGAGGRGRELVGAGIAGRRPGQEHLMTDRDVPTGSPRPTRRRPRRHRGRRAAGRRRRPRRGDGVGRRGRPGRRRPAAGGGPATAAGAGGRAGTSRPPERRASLSSRLYNGEAGLDVVGHSRLIYKITAVVVLLCIASMVFRGFNFGIDFAGGNSFRLPGTDRAAGRGPRGGRGRRRRGGQRADRRRQHRAAAHRRSWTTTTERAVVDAVADAAGIEPNQVSPESVSAEWGSDITDQALIALAVFLVAVIALPGAPVPAEDGRSARSPRWCTTSS